MSIAQTEHAELLPERHTLHRSRGGGGNKAVVFAVNTSEAVAIGLLNGAGSSAGQIIVIGQR